jgi:hypothetical protein
MLKSYKSLLLRCLEFLFGGMRKLSLIDNEVKFNGRGNENPKFKSLFLKNNIDSKLGF